MKFRNLHILLFLFIIFSCNKSKNIETKKTSIVKSGISEQLIYDFTNQILSENGTSEFCKNIIDRKIFIAPNADSLLLEKIKSDFSKDDLNFMKIQFNEGNKFVWKNNLRDRRIIKLNTTIDNENKAKEFWDKTLDKYHCISSVGMPVFNKERNLAIIEISYNCGLLCASGGTFIYKLEKNKKWKLYKTINSWVS